MASTLTSNMSLISPTVGLQLAPDWALNLDTDLSIIDQHDHTPGNGVPIPSSALNINSDLSFLNNNAISLRSIRFQSASVPLAGASDLGCLYESGVDLYYNDGNGNQIRLTQSGSIAGTSGSITNLVSPASVTYVSGTPAFVFQSAANTSANLDGGALTLRQNTASAKGVTLHSPNSLASDYDVTFMATLPAATSILRIDSSGNVSSNLVVDGSTIVISSNQLQIPSNVNLPGNLVEAGGSPVITSATPATNGLYLLRGEILSNGTINSGEGFTITHVSTGIYNINYTHTFTDTPAVVATTINAQAYVANLTSTTTSVCQVVTKLSSSQVPADVGWNFIVIGQK